MHNTQTSARRVRTQLRFGNRLKPDFRFHTDNTIEIFSGFRTVIRSLLNVTHEYHAFGKGELHWDSQPLCH